jgi:hypothetical protein
MEALARGVRVLREELARLSGSVNEFRDKAKFNGDDSAFLTFVLGFTAGAHLNRDGQQRDVIFARCRDIYMKGFPGAGPLAPGGNAS